MQSGTLKDERHTESAPPPLSPPLQYSITCDCCGSRSVDLTFAQRWNLLLTTAFRTREPPVCTVANLLQRFLRAVLFGGGRYVVVLKRRLFLTAHSATYNKKKAFCVLFKNWMPASRAFASPRLCNTFNTEHSPNTEPVSRDRVYNFILDVCVWVLACVRVYISIWQRIYVHERKYF